jgi:hypothetical protein
MRYLIRISLIFGVFFLFGGAGTKEIKLTEGIQPGNLAPEINLQGVNFDENEYVLVQFWAAYDPQSRVENSQMHNAISQSKVSNLRMISISFDENQAVFEGVIKADRLDETSQFHEPLGQKSPIFKNYRLKAGFTNCLINSDGVIVAKNLSPKDLLK